MYINIYSEKFQTQYVKYLEKYKKMFRQKLYWLEKKITITQTIKLIFKKKSFFKVI